VLYKKYNLLCYCSNSINFFYYYINIIPCTLYQILSEQNVLHADAIPGKSINSVLLYSFTEAILLLQCREASFNQCLGEKLLR